MALQFSRLYRQDERTPALAGFSGVSEYLTNESNVPSFFKYVGNNGAYTEGYYLVEKQAETTQWTLAQSGVTYYNVDYKIDTSVTPSLSELATSDLGYHSNGVKETIRIYANIYDSYTIWFGNGSNRYNGGQTGWGSNVDENGQLTVWANYGYFSELKIPSAYTTNNWFYVKPHSATPVAQPLFDENGNRVG